MQRQARERACLGGGSSANAFKTECVPVSEPKDWEMEAERKRRREDVVLAWLLRPQPNITNWIYK